MEFGKLHDISLVNFTLPDDDQTNKNRLKASCNFTLYFGSPAFSVKHFEGKIYPLKTPQEEYLSFYSKNFNSIELNTSHYRIPDEKTIYTWKSKVGKNFKFCPKLHKDISHSKMGLMDKNLLSAWTKFLNGLGENLGPSFIQFHEMFSYDDKGLLFNFLKNWPSEFQLCLELRHSSWYENRALIPRLTDFLHEKNIGLAITDVAGRRDITHSTLSTNYSMIRLIGNNLDPSDTKRLEDWAQRIAEWKKLGLNEIYLFLHQPDDIFTIEFSKMAEEIFIRKKFEDVPHFSIIEKQIDLFNFENEN